MLNSEIQLIFGDGTLALEARQATHGGTRFPVLTVYARNWPVPMGGVGEKLKEDIKFNHTVNLIFKNREGLKNFQKWINRIEENFEQPENVNEIFNSDSSNDGEQCSRDGGETPKTSTHTE